MNLLSRWVAGQPLVTQKAIAVTTLTPDVLDDGTLSGYYTGSSTTSGLETVEHNFATYVEGIYKRNGIVFACIAARQMPFSEARFQLQEIVDGRPGKLFDDPSLEILRNPWTNATTGELLSRMEQDASLAGNFYATPVTAAGRRWIRRMRPDWVTIVSGVRDDRGVPDPTRSPLELESEVLGYIYAPPGVEPTLLSPDRVVHYSPYPDPDAQWRGMSWITPIIREVQADQYATLHKVKHYQNGSALSTVVSYDASIDPMKFKKFVELFEEHHRGSENAYKTLHLGGGADVTALDTSLKTDFKAVQGAGETRIAAASGVGAIIGRFSEGLAGSALNQGNYAAAKRQVADMTLRPLWRMAAASLSKLVNVPAGAQLWTDTRDVEFLKEDRKDAAEIMQITATTINSLVSAGYTPDSVTIAVETGDLSRLEHSGLYSVQLQKAGQRQELTPPQDSPPAALDATPKAALDALVKAGARNSASDLALIQGAHDNLAQAGATCPTP